jgi:hypothetical protein
MVTKISVFVQFREYCLKGSSDARDDLLEADFTGGSVDPTCGA